MGQWRRPAGSRRERPQPRNLERAEVPQGSNEIETEVVERSDGLAIPHLIAGLLEALRPPPSLDRISDPVDGGRRLRGTAVRAHADHRIAMAAAIAAVGIDAGVRVTDIGCAKVSYPDFVRDYQRLGGTVA